MEMLLLVTLNCNMGVARTYNPKGDILAKYLKIYIHVSKEFINRKKLFVFESTTKNGIDCYQFEFQNTIRDIVGHVSN
jgi:hypothetical protein